MKNITVYWAAMSDDGNRDWGILYKEPIPLRSYLEMNKENTSVNFFSCPAFKDMIHNVFVIENPINSSLKIKDYEINPTSKTWIASSLKQPSIVDNNLFEYIYLNIFLADTESLKMEVTSPYFLNAPHMKYGSLVPGTFDVAKWFRPINMEFNLWNGVDTFSINEGEPMAFIKFHTDAKINFKRFKLTNEVLNVSRTCSTGSGWEPNVSLLKRYKRFKESKIKDYLLKKINENLF